MGTLLLTDSGSPTTLFIILASFFGAVLCLATLVLGLKMLSVICNLIVGIFRSCFAVISSPFAYFGSLIGVRITPRFASASTHSHTDNADYDAIFEELYREERRRSGNGYYNFYDENEFSKEASSYIPPAEEVNPYDVLGVAKNASRQEIAKAYRTLMLKNHPDKVAELDPAFQKLANERTIRIQQAYEALSRSK